MLQKSCPRNQVQREKRMYLQINKNAAKMPPEEWGWINRAVLIPMKINKLALSESISKLTTRRYTFKDKR